MDWNTIPENILLDWINYEIGTVQSREANILSTSFSDLIKLNPTDKAIRLQSYLQIRVSGKLLDLAALPQKIQSETDLLNSDIDVCSSVLVDLSASLSNIIGK